jgi:hypothetical protein
LLVIGGGHSRNVGKTSVMAGLIAALPECQWTAVKITQYGHGVCSDHGAQCGCADPVHPFAVDEEHDAAAGTDTSRYLAAGARRAFWVRTAMGQLGEALPALRDIFKSSENVICESNSLLQFIKPDLYVPVLDFGIADFKTSALRYLDRADAVLVHASAAEPAWRGVAQRLCQGKPRFEAHPPQYVPDGLVQFLRMRLGHARA